MIDEWSLYALTSSLFVLSLVTVWLLKRLTTGKAVTILFVFDIALTIEAAFYADVVMIALLHVITIPAFFALIYFDLIQQHKTKFRCFICGRIILESEKMETLKRFTGGEKKEINVHAACIGLESHERKRFSTGSFKKGIPE